ncbi:hypothetical protein K431DRAFT_233463 [Polychaeton citri CBS 116435]|uniref:Uncharacterized protein n=1 Tax=Polychaeton citri CBS 116435 TaxID=1314669 RepID=A0A9P4Q051_9PEZI|nr:hypothetical protein K431DRAFT_233463 [Polychaeton citri CBS 116435]
MAATDGSSAVANGDHASKIKPIEVAISLPSNPGTRLHLHLTTHATSFMLFLTTASIEGGNGLASMGSLVYAMPDRYNPSQPLSTPLYTLPSTLDFATRLAKLLARRTKMACYVGSSVNLSDAIGGGTVEEEMEAFRAVVDTVIAEIGKIEPQPG